MMRLFFALWPPAEAAQALADWARALPGRPTPAEKIHLTLAYLGAADPAKATAAAARVAATAFALPIERAQHWRRNEIVWVGPRETPAGLAALVERLQLELYRAEFILEPRPFAAHVTLARRARAPRSLPPLPRIGWPAAEFALVASAGGAYRTLERFRLSSAPA